MASFTYECFVPAKGLVIGETILVRQVQLVKVLFLTCMFFKL